MKINRRKQYWLVIIGLITFFSLSFRLLNHYNFHTSALLYVGLPMIIAVVLLLFARPSASTHWAIGYWHHTRAALIVMLGSSIVLFEGFLCVIMFMPIYFGVMALAFIIEGIYRACSKKSGNRMSVHILPVLVMLSAFEGVSPSLSFERFNEVSVTKTLNLSSEQIKDNLIKPMVLGDDMPAFLSLFPMPYDIEAETLNEGDVHRSYFRYHRWFVTNTHEGHLDLKLADVKEHFIRAEVIENSSYLSHYLDLHGSTIALQPISDTSTEVTLTVTYDRKLDPAWYFDPLERFAVKQTASYLIDKVLQGEIPHE